MSDNTLDELVKAVRQISRIGASQNLKSSPDVLLNFKCADDYYRFVSSIRNSTGALTSACFLPLSDVLESRVEVSSVLQIAGVRVMLIAKDILKNDNSPLV